MYIKVRELDKPIPTCYNTQGINAKYEASLCKEKNNTVSLYCDGINSEYCNEFRNDQKNWQRLNPPFNVHFEGCFYDKNCTQKTKPKSYNDNENNNNNVYSCDIKYKKQCEYDDGSEEFTRFCKNAYPGTGNDPNACYVGDTDPCNLVDSGEDYCPIPCFNKFCCPGTNFSNKPIQQHKCIGKDQKCFRRCLN